MNGIANFVNRYYIDYWEILVDNNIKFEKKL